MYRASLLVFSLMTVACEPQEPEGLVDEATALELAVSTPTEMTLAYFDALRDAYKVERLMVALAPEGVRTGTLSEWDGEWRYQPTEDGKLVVEPEALSPIVFIQYEFEGDVSLPFEEFLHSDHDVEVHYEHDDLLQAFKPVLFSNFNTRLGLVFQLVRRVTRGGQMLALSILGQHGGDVDKEEENGSLQSFGWALETDTSVHFIRGGDIMLSPIRGEEVQQVLYRVGDEAQVSLDRTGSAEWNVAGEGSLRDTRFRSEYLGGRPVPSDYWRAEGVYVVDGRDVATLSLERGETSMAIVTELDGERVELQSFDLEP